MNACRIVVRVVVSVGLVALLSSGCAPRPTATVADASLAHAVVLDCTAADIHHTFHIRASDHVVDDVSFSPAKRGLAEVSASEYLLRFPEPRDHYELMLQVDKATGTGMRRLFDDEQQAIKGHGGTDPVVCTERAMP